MKKNMYIYFQAVKPKLTKFHLAGIYAIGISRFGFETEEGRGKNEANRSQEGKANGATWHGLLQQIVSNR